MKQIRNKKDTIIETNDKHEAMDDITKKREEEELDDFFKALDDFINSSSEEDDEDDDDEEEEEPNDFFEALDDSSKDDEEDDDDEEEENEARRIEYLETEAKLQAKDFEASLAFLDDMVGMEHVKQKMLRLGRYAQWMKKLEIAGIDTSVFPQPNLTFMFLGDPGTGKTTVAMQMGSILKSIGLLTSDQVHEYRREDLVGQNYGCEEQNTKEALNESDGGVFFLDEAYQCFKQSTDKRDPAYHILETMMQHFGKPNRCIIMAGYKSEMMELFKVNPGFRSRIPQDNIIEFSRPSEQMLMDVATNTFRRMSLDVTHDADATLREHIHQIWLNKDKSFGNARVIRQLAESIIINHANRIMTSTDSDCLTISQSDIRQSIVPLQTTTPTLPHIGFV